MKFTTLILAFTFLVNLTNGQKNDEQLTMQFDKLLSEQFKANEPGATVLVARNGHVVYKKAFGMANLELDVPMQTGNIFRIASITKQFTAIAVLQLMEQGKLNLQDEITRFIPDYPTQGSKITIEHLLTHTSGIRDYATIRDSTGRGTVDLTPVQMINYFKNQPMRFPPGTKWEYSNSGYFLLGYIIEKITTKTYGEYIEENIFKPLGMNNSLYASDTKFIKNRVNGYTIGKNGFENAHYLSMTHPYAAGAILSNVEDLFKWQQAVQSYKLVKKETLDKALTRYKTVDGQETNYGYGWKLGYVYESPNTWHGGLINGFKTLAMYLPKEDVFVAVLSNCDLSSPEVVTSRLAALAVGKPFEYTEIPLEKDNLQGYVGVYENDKGLQRIITASENKLYSQLGRGPKAQIKAYQKDKFFFNAMQTIEFSGKSGKVETLTTKYLAGNETWNKTNKPIPDENEIKVAENILESYVGLYEIAPERNISITREGNKLFLQITRQEKLEAFADTESKFFLKINDTQIEFIKDGSGKVMSATINQGGRRVDARKLK